MLRLPLSERSQPVAPGLDGHTRTFLLSTFRPSGLTHLHPRTLSGPTGSPLPLPYSLRNLVLLVVAIHGYDHCSRPCLSEFMDASMISVICCSGTLETFRYVPSLSLFLLKSLCLFTVLLYLSTNATHCRRRILVRLERQSCVMQRSQPYRYSMTPFIHESLHPW